MDLDRLKFSIINDLKKSLRNDSKELADNFSDDLDSLIDKHGAEGKIKINKTEAGAVAKANVKVPSDNAAKFAIGVDNAINKNFRFGKWSDMKI